MWQLVKGPSLKFLDQKRRREFTKQIPSVTPNTATNKCIDTGSLRNRMLKAIPQTGVRNPKDDTLVAK